MALASLYDALFGAAILLFPAPAGRILGIPLPDDRLYFDFVGIFVLLLAAMYVLPARDPRRYQGVVLVAALGRLVGFAYMAWRWTEGAPDAFLALACGDLAFSVLHGVLLVAARGAEAIRR
jgi:hypothetical protein